MSESGESFPPAPPVDAGHDSSRIQHLKDFLSGNRHKLTPNQAVRLDEELLKDERKDYNEDSSDDIESDQALYDAKFGHEVPTQQKGVITKQG